MAREEKAYARVIEKVKTMILSGELKPGEKLPPEREFAEKLAIMLPVNFRRASPRRWR